MSAVFFKVISGDKLVQEMLTSFEQLRVVVFFTRPVRLPFFSLSWLYLIMCMAYIFASYELYCLQLHMEVTYASSLLC
jgi:hypothetical protein